MLKFKNPIVINHGDKNNPAIYHYGIFIKDVTAFYNHRTRALHKIWRVRLADGKLWDVFKDNCI